MRSFTQLAYPVPAVKGCDGDHVWRVIFHTISLLKADGRFLLVEPKGHVGQEDFEREVAAVQAAGLSIQSRPKIAISRAALFSRE